MYKACRHIKPNGMRCKSRALAGGFFCYFHSKLHDSTASSEPEPLKLPVPEDLASIPIAVARISEALIANRIDVKQSAQLFWGLKLAYQAIVTRNDQLPYSVMSVTKTADGDELAPEITLCVPGSDCRTCRDAETCADSTFVPGYDDDFGDEDDDGDEDAPDSAGEDDEGEEEEDSNNEAGDDAEQTKRNDGEEDAADGDHGESDSEEDGNPDARDDNDDDDDDEFAGGTTEDLIADLQYLAAVKKSLDLGT
jgi:hypothetical protein